MKWRALLLPLEDRTRWTVLAAYETETCRAVWESCVIYPEFEIPSYQPTTECSKLRLEKFFFPFTVILVQSILAYKGKIGSGWSSSLKREFKYH